MILTGHLIPPQFRFSMQEITKGIVAVIHCHDLGRCAVYYIHLKHVPPVEILSHRTLWSFLFRHSSDVSKKAGGGRRSLAKKPFCPCLRPLL